MTKFFNRISLLALIVVISACAQSRRGIQIDQGSEVWKPIEICQNNGFTAQMCFEATLHFSDNYLSLRVLDKQLEAVRTAVSNGQSVNQQNYTYRVLARPESVSTWHILKEKQSAGIGEVIELDPAPGYYIEEYVEVIVELEYAPLNAQNYVEADPGNGEKLVWDQLCYLETDDC